MVTSRDIYSGYVSGFGQLPQTSIRSGSSITRTTSVPMRSTTRSFYYVHPTSPSQTTIEPIPQQQVSSLPGYVQAYQTGGTEGVVAYLRGTVQSSPVSRQNIIYPTATSQPVIISGREVKEHTPIIGSGAGIFYPVDPTPKYHEGGTTMSSSEFDKELGDMMDRYSSYSELYKTESKKLKTIGESFISFTPSQDAKYIVSPFFPSFIKKSELTGGEEYIYGASSKIYGSLSKLGVTTPFYTKILSPSETKVYTQHFGEYQVKTAEQYLIKSSEITNIVQGLSQIRQGISDWHPSTKVVKYDPSKFHVEQGFIKTGGEPDVVKSGTFKYLYDFPFYGAEKYYTYKSKLESDPGRTAALGFGWGGYANIDIAYYKLTGQTEKAVEKQIGQLARYDVARETLRSGDIGGFSGQYWMGYLGSPATQIGLVWSGGKLIGTGSKIVSKTVFAQSHPTTMAVGKIIGGITGGALIGYGVYDISRTVETGDIGGAVGKSWLFGTSLAAGVAGYQSGQLYKPQLAIGEGKSGEMVLQRYITSFKGKPILRYGKPLGIYESGRLHTPSLIDLKDIKFQTMKQFKATHPLMDKSFYYDVNKPINISPSLLKPSHPSISLQNISNRLGASVISKSFDKWVIPKGAEHLPMIPESKSFTYQGLKGTFVFTFTPETVGITRVVPIDKTGFIGKLLGDVKVSSDYGITSGETDFIGKSIDRIEVFKPKIIDLSDISSRSNFVETFSRFWKREYVDVEGMGRIQLGINIESKQDILGLVEGISKPSSASDLVNMQFFGSFRKLPKTPLLVSDVAKPWYTEKFRVLYETDFAKSFTAVKRMGGTVSKPGKYGLETVEYPEFKISRSLSVINDKLLQMDTGLIWRQKPLGLGLPKEPVGGRGISDYQLSQFLQQRTPLTVEEQISGMLSGLSLSQYEAKGITNLLKPWQKSDIEQLKIIDSMVKPRGVKIIDEEIYISDRWKGIRPSIDTSKQFSNINKNISKITDNLKPTDITKTLKPSKYLSVGIKTGMLNLSRLGVGTISASKLGLSTISMLKTDLLSKTDVTTKTIQMQQLALATTLIPQIQTIQFTQSITEPIQYTPPPPVPQGFLLPGIDGGRGMGSYPGGWFGKKYKFRKFRVVDLFKDIKIGFRGI